MWKAKVGFYCHLYKIQTHTHTIYYLLLIGEEYSKTQWRIYVNNYWFANNKVHTQQEVNGVACLHQVSILSSKRKTE